jgi:hypothetical protein
VHCDVDEQPFVVHPCVVMPCPVKYDTAVPGLSKFA